MCCTNLFCFDNHIGDRGGGPARSNRHDLAVQVSSFHQQDKVVGVRRHDDITVSHEHHERGVDDVTTPGGFKKSTGISSERCIERTDLDAAEQSREPGLPGRASPNLPYDAAVGERRYPPEHELVDAESRRFMPRS